MSGNLSFDGGRRESLSSGISEVDLNTSFEPRIILVGETSLARYFNEEQISEIKKKAPDLKVMVDHATASLEGGVTNGISLSKETGLPVVFEYNDIVVVVTENDNPKGVLADCDVRLQKSDEAYWTPERRAEERPRQQAHKISDKVMEILFTTLPKNLKDWVLWKEKMNLGRSYCASIAFDAHLVASALKTHEAVDKWAHLGLEEQKRLVPGYLGVHSMHSFGQMVSLAAAYLKAGPVGDLRRSPEGSTGWYTRMLRYLRLSVE